ncbi:hypothetical protein NDU88_004446 [Pleurodeles waltl]|uniref:Uncharacterized protein n=1 Tax=Pleurodeles waltl TaxID=8319 RepID=A0AAV7MVH0_PLEWA|nr:hypothetical protein NDU88_004446 [Pleurodeles waltl]
MAATGLLGEKSEMAHSVDRRVLQAMQLLREAGRLDLLAEHAARRERPVRQAVWRPRWRHARHLAGIVGGWRPR